MKCVGCGFCCIRFICDVGFSEVGGKEIYDKDGNYQTLLCNALKWNGNRYICDVYHTKLKKHCIKENIILDGTCFVGDVEALEDCIVGKVLKEFRNGIKERCYDDVDKLYSGYEEDR